MRMLNIFKTAWRGLTGPLVPSTSSVEDEQSKHIDQELRIASVAFESHSAMLVTDSDQRILRVNRTLSERSGFSAEELIGRQPEILHHDLNNQAFCAAIRSQLQCNGFWQGEMLTHGKAGDTNLVSTSITAVKDEDNKIGNYVWSYSDALHRKAVEEEIRQLAYYDALTKLGNRRLLLKQLKQAIDQANRTGDHGALFFIDLDNFKSLNDMAGHEVGDKLLQQVAARLKTCVGAYDTVARLGGDEFVVVMVGLSTDADEALLDIRNAGERILTTLNGAYNLGGQTHYSSPSVGVAMFEAGNHTVNDLLSRADLAMYNAKSSGKNTIRHFDHAMRAIINERSQIEKAMRHGLQTGQFLLHYQSQMKRDGVLMGAEALVRWQHPQRGLLSPMEFITIAEESGLIIPLGLFVLEAACTQLVDWERRFDLHDFSMSVNVSARQIRHPEFVEQVLAVIKKTGANPRMLKLELTESLLVDNVEDTIEKMMALRSHGVGFSLDDFGTGYSSLSYLKRLPLDQLKIDKSFVHDVLNEQNDADIAKMILALGRSLGLTVIAEGVETEGQRAFLIEHGCHAYQGYLFGRPAEAPRFEACLWELCENRAGGNIVLLENIRARQVNAHPPSSVSL